MSSTDIFKKPFDDGTKTKLEIFRNYLREWLPVFLAKQEVVWNKIQIFDFCSGKGKDIDGSLGSPLIILTELNNWVENIVTKKLNVRIVLNEYDKNLFADLVPLVNELRKTNVYETVIENDTFHNVFDKSYDSMRNSANLLFIDQSGVKEITEDIFGKIINLKPTDFLFFISSSFISRFAESDEFKKHLKITRTDIQGKSYFHIHKIVLEYYRSLIPKSKEYYLAPFSIKKGSNIYGLIFGTNHTLGIEKFLNVCWRIDKQRGEANFDIDKEKINHAEPSLFPEMNVPNKRQLFEDELAIKILNKELISDRIVYLFALSNGFLPKDANKVLKELKNHNKIDFEFNIVTGDIHKIKVPSLIKLK
jgi:three-Cys-motif partner protein